MQILDEPTWRARAAAHADRVDQFVQPHLARRHDGVKHPVHDFLFTYYSQRPAQLRRWHPGFGVALAGGSSYAGLKGYVVSTGSTGGGSGSTTVTVSEESLVSTGSTGGGCGSTTVTVSEESLVSTGSTGGGCGSTTVTVPEESLVSTGSTGGGCGSTTVTVPEESLVSTGSTGGGCGSTTVTVSEEYLASQQLLVQSIHALLTATAARTPSFGCLGLHEWAMVYRQDETRHNWPLRLGSDGTDTVVESHRITCSHFDAFRFFTPPAVPLNTLQPGRDDRVAFEQTGCLHAGMDLYKHAFRLTPLICSDLVVDCFELARDIRVLDMRAAPYDLSDLGLAPVRIETTQGKQEYAAAQRRFAERAAPLRATLIAECERLLEAVPAAIYQLVD
jgi:hypothetical protein